MGQGAGPLRASSHEVAQLEAEEEHRGWAAEPGQQVGVKGTSGADWDPGSKMCTVAFAPVDAACRWA